jgi:hypothetical protein
MDWIYLFKIVLYVLETYSDGDTLEENRATVLDYLYCEQPYVRRERFYLLKGNEESRIIIEIPMLTAGSA